MDKLIIPMYGRAYHSLITKLADEGIIAEFKVSTLAERARGIKMNILVHTYNLEGLSPNEMFFLGMRVQQIIATTLS